MIAKQAVDGGRYRLPADSPKKIEGPIECIGWNYTNEWLLFVYFDEFGKRKVTMLAPHQEIEVL